MKPDAIKAVAAAALAWWETVAAALDPGYQVEGDAVLLLNVARGDKHRGSYGFNRVTGASCDFATGEGGDSDLVGFWARHKGIPQGKAAEEIAALLGVDVDSLGPAPGGLQREAKAPPSPVPPEAVAALAGLKEWARGKLYAVAFWEVRDQAGSLLMVRARIEEPGKDPVVVPFTWRPGPDGRSPRWSKGGSCAGLFYGLDRLASRPAAPVLICEGEKTTDAAAALFPSHVVLGLQGASSARKVDLSPLKGRAVVLWPDADQAGDEAMRCLAARLGEELGTRARLVALPAPVLEWCKPSRPGKPGGWDLADAAPQGVDVRALLEAAAVVELGRSDGAGGEERPAVERAGCYLIDEGRVCIEKDGEPRALCNFTARIREEVIRDDGKEDELTFLVEGRLASGEALPEARVPAASFPGMGWAMGAWGARAIINSGAATKDNLRAAIQHLSRPTRRRVFLNTGWRKINGQWCYLCAGGAIGANGAVPGVETEMGDRLGLYSLGAPLEGEELARAMSVSLEALGLGPDPITAPVWLSAFRSTLDDCPFSLHVSGTKGSGKSELAAVAMGHFGPALESKNHLANWASTTASMERALFLAKDALAMVDDFRPGEGRKGKEEMEAKADRIFRGAFNRSSRERLSSDARTLRGAYWCQGLILSTGEDLPRGESLRSRVLCLEWPMGAMRWELLTCLQEERAKGTHAGLMAAFIRWQAKDRDRVLAIRSGAHQEARARLGAVAHSNRTADIAAELWSAWPVLEVFARETGCMQDGALGSMHHRLWAALVAMTGAQAGHAREVDPTELFRDGLTGCLSSLRGHLVPVDTDNMPPEWVPLTGWVYGRGPSGETRLELDPKGLCLGFLALGDQEVWLHGEAAYNEASKVVDPGVSERALWKRLRECQALVPEFPGRHKSRRTIPGGGRPSFVVLRLDFLWPQAEGPGVVQSGPLAQSGNGTVPHETLATTGFGTVGTLGSGKAYPPPHAHDDEWRLAGP